MKTRVLVLTIFASAVALVASVAPAFTVTAPDSGSVTGTVTAVGGGACLELTNTAVSFGTLPFSTRSQVSSGSGTPTPTFKNCGNFNETISIAGTDATGVNTSWALNNKLSTNPCLDAAGAAQINLYDLFFDASPVGRVKITKTATPISTYGAGVATPLGLQLSMPCVGSSGDGQSVSFSINLTAVVA
jgi:hypothetical protein